jgi:hypothetical protein
MSVESLKKVCEKIPEKEDEKNKIFYTVSMHGEETARDFVIPKNVRIVMFCYSGRLLHICPKFDLFNWENIFLDENATYNWCTFLSTLYQYPSLRDHFCIYEEGDIIKDINFGIDPYFRDGVYKLPITGLVKEDDTVYISSDKIFHKAIGMSAKRIIVDKKKVAKTLRDKEGVGQIYSYYDTFRAGYSLSRLLGVLSVYNKGFTLLLLTCREGVGYPNISKGKNVSTELEKLYSQYKNI